MVIFEIIVFFIIPLVFIIYYFRTKENYISPSETEEFLKQQIEINKENYKKFIIEREELDNDLKEYNEKKNQNIEFGYNKMINTNKKTLGFCPLGEFYKQPEDKDFVGDINNLNHCTKCQDCSEKPGWYLGNGCLGDKDSDCQFGKLPLDLYLRGHSKNTHFHKPLSQHNHKYVNEENYSSINHNHF